MGQSSCQGKSQLWVHSRKEIAEFDLNLVVSSMHARHDWHHEQGSPSSEGHACLFIILALIRYYSLLLFVCQLWVRIWKMLCRQIWLFDPSRQLPRSNNVLTGIAADLPIDFSSVRLYTCWRWNSDINIFSSEALGVWPCDNGDAVLQKQIHVLSWCEA